MLACQLVPMDTTSTPLIRTAHLAVLCAKRAREEAARSVSPARIHSTFRLRFLSACLLAIPTNIQHPHLLPPAQVAILLA